MLLWIEYVSSPPIYMLKPQSSERSVCGNIIFKWALILSYRCANKEGKLGHTKTHQMCA